MRLLTLILTMLISSLAVSQKHCFSDPPEVFLAGEASMYNNPDEDFRVFSAGVAVKLGRLQLSGMLGKLNTDEGTGSWLEENQVYKLVDSYTVDSTYTVNGKTYHIDKEVSVFDTVPTTIPKLSVAEFKYLTFDFSADILVLSAWEKLKLYAGVGALFQLKYDQSVPYPPQGDNVSHRRVLESVRAKRQGNIMPSAGIAVEYNPVGSLYLYYRSSYNLYLWDIRGKDWFVKNTLGIKFRINDKHYSSNGSKRH